MIDTIQYYDIVFYNTLIVPTREKKIVLSYLERYHHVSQIASVESVALPCTLKYLLH